MPTLLDGSKYMQRPKVICLDAVGTLFKVRDSVGGIYAKFAEQFEIKACADHLNEAFKQAFAEAPPPAFGMIQASSDLRAREKAYWHTVVYRCFQLAYPEQPFKNFTLFFETVFEYFSTAEAWCLYPETRAALSLWQTQGIHLGIISNFDSRLHQVLAELKLTQFFESITISTEVGAAKPSTHIFAAALKPHAVSPQNAYHIGDSWYDDYLGAQSSGLNSIWLNRTSAQHPMTTQSVHSITQLDALVWES